MAIVNAIRVEQWLPDWDKVVFDGEMPRSKPRPYFLLFSLNVYDLKRLCGVYRRDPTLPPALDMSVQRGHVTRRSEEILRYVQDGFPLSRINKDRLTEEQDEVTLRMPGWLPTAVVVNILEKGDHGGGNPGNPRIRDRHLVSVTCSNRDNTAHLTLPDGLRLDDWAPDVHPMEVIDGQHRLWAFEEPSDDGKKWPAGVREKLKTVNIPVVAFHGLDRTWQAYLFYTINHLAASINISQIFDLYPLLRNADWLLRFSGPKVYREARAQELVTILWQHPESNWKNRILRLGGREPGKVTQAAYVRSLLASFIKSWQPNNPNRIGGLFGAPIGTHHTVLGWGIEQQAAFLIAMWIIIRESVTPSTSRWARELMKATGSSPSKSGNQEELFSGSNTLLATDQGVRAVMCVINDLVVLGPND